MGISHVKSIFGPLCYCLDWIKWLQKTTHSLMSYSPPRTDSKDALINCFQLDKSNSHVQGLEPCMLIPNISKRISACSIFVMLLQCWCNLWCCCSADVLWCCPTTVAVVVMSLAPVPVHRVLGFFGYLREETYPSGDSVILVWKPGVCLLSHWLLESSFVRWAWQHLSTLLMGLRDLYITAFCWWRFIFVLVHWYTSQNEKNCTAETERLCSA